MHVSNFSVSHTLVRKVMATATCELCEDQFLCSICLEVFTRPVTLPCGHNFCHSCIHQHWATDAACRCPYCKQGFHPKPDLKVNVFIAEMCEQFRRSQGESNSSARSSNSSPQEVCCDFCTTKSRAVKSCLVCSASFCQSHLEPHLSLESLRGHELRDLRRRQGSEVRVESLRGHELHDLRRRQGSEVEERSDAEIQEMIATRERGVEQLRRLMELNDQDADAELTHILQAFSALRDLVDRDLDAAVLDITRKRKSTEDGAEACVKALQREASELRDGAPPSAGDRTHVNLRTPTYEGATARAMAQLEQRLEQQLSGAFSAELQRVRRYNLSVVFDPDETHAKPADQSGARRSSAACRCALAGQRLSTGRFYFEVDVRGRSQWAVGVARELHAHREVALSPRHAYWAVCRRSEREWYAGSEPPARLALRGGPGRVGVFVDCEDGLVSFHDAERGAPIYTFTGCALAPHVRPFFSPCENDGVRLHVQPESSCVLQ